MTTQRPVRALAVVVLNVDAQHSLELARSENEKPVETLRPHGPHEALRVGIRPRRPKRSLDYSDALATEDLVEGGAELRVAVVDQEPNVGERIGEAEVARLLRDPAPIRIFAGAGEADAAALKLDEEEHVVPTQEGSLDREEVARQDARRLLAQELAPSRPRAPLRSRESKRLAAASKARSAGRSLGWPTWRRRMSS
jgi:hypothetical protein